MKKCFEVTLGNHKEKEDWQYEIKSCVLLGDST